MSCLTNDLLHDGLVTLPTQRPAHRPSRRHDVVQVGMDLLAQRPLEDVTVADIAAASGMTSTAIYYHFTSKEDILKEGVEEFSDALTSELAERLDRAEVEGTTPGVVIVDMITWLNTIIAPATVFFVMSSGQSVSVEIVRRHTRAALVILLRSHLEHMRHDLSPAEAAVCAVGLLSLLETAGTSWLNPDADRSTLGERRFLSTVANLADAIIGPIRRRSH